VNWFDHVIAANRFDLVATCVQACWESQPAVDRFAVERLADRIFKSSPRIPE